MQIDKSTIITDIGALKIADLLKIISVLFDFNVNVSNILENYFSHLKLYKFNCKFDLKNMAGHSHAHNIMFKKGANDAKKAKIFTKIARDIQVAAKNGIPDPELNPKLKLLVAKARTMNMPKDKIASAIEKANKDTTNYENVRYNAFFDRGISVIIEGLTDNKNRTASDVRGVLNKFDAQMASTGSVEFMYSHIGRIVYPANVCEEERMFEIAVNAGANDVYKDEDVFIIETNIENMIAVVTKLTEELKQEPQSAEWFWKANEYINDIDDKEFLSKYQKLLDALDDLDDVTEVYTNADLVVE